MKRYSVEVPVRVVALYEVFANNAEEAKKLVLAGEGDFDEHINFNEDHDTNNWIAEVSQWV